MKRDKIIYWVTTGIVSAVMLFSAINFNLEKPYGPTDGFSHLKLPEYFKKELTVAKILGALALLIPGIPYKIKEFAYAGFAITLMSASFAHYSSGDGFMFIIDPLIFLCILSISYRYLNKLKADKLSFQV